MPTAASVDCLTWREGQVENASRMVPEETPLSLTYNGGAYAVMMGTPDDLEDFAIGFSLGEGIIASPADLASFEVMRFDHGVELRMWLDQAKADHLGERRRHIAGPTGCGLCGIDSIAEAVRAPRRVGPGRSFAAEQIVAAIQGMAPLQPLHLQTRAVHAAAFWTPERGIVALREDVGRHNALDKLAGALARQGIEAAGGIVLLTSRVSVEMVQKTAAMGAPVLVAVSAPTALAVQMATEAGITLAAIARRDGFEVFTHHHRIVLAASAGGKAGHVA
jgi:FdhD protein